MNRKSTRFENYRRGWDRRCKVKSVLLLSIVGLTPAAANAYTAAGDRNFPATLILPQVGPADAFWGTPSTQPMTTPLMQPMTNSGMPPMVNTGMQPMGGMQPIVPTAAGDTTRETTFTGTYSKLITERLGIQLEDGAVRQDRLDASSKTGAQNLHLVLQYEPIIDQAHEFVFSLQVDQEFGGTGNHRVGQAAQSATTPGLLFGKGFGDLPIGYLRPLAITGYAGYQFGYGRRLNQTQAGFSVQYSMPYLLSKVAAVPLPPIIRGMTPITEVYYTSGGGEAAPFSQGQGTTLLIAPGISYTQGTGWEFAVEARIPATKATGRSVGVIGQLLIQLDYLLPDSSFGHPIFYPH